MATGIIADDGMLYAMLTQFPGGQTGALIARPSFIHPNMQFYAGLVRRVYGRQRRADIDGRQPTRIAMGEDMVDLGIFWRRLLHEGQSVLAYGLILQNVFITNLFCLGPGNLRTFSVWLRQH